MVDVRNFLAWAVLAVGTNAAAIGQVRPGATEALFSVRDIPVDATAQAAAQARERALAVGQRQAFERLVARLTQPDDGARLGAIDDDAIQALVLGIELSDERTSPVRYLAKLTVRFQPGAIRQRLAAAGIPMVETLSAPLLVLPVYATADTVVLWDDPNPWREAWNAAPAADGLVPLLFPVGDLADMEDVGPEHAVAGDGDRLRRIAQRYGAGDAIVVEARLAEAGEENADRHLHITATRHGSVPTTEVKETFVVPANRALDDALRVAVAWVRGE
ncbi:MAG: DUF2066 domain-containing protein, partial [Alphaproteobacteria bacterium]|nr:DUF2066 domain-containing protein [Alphaproteobacteria bacterium]